LHGGLLALPITLLTAYFAPISPHTADAEARISIGYNEVITLFHGQADALKPRCGQDIRASRILSQRSKT
jgi:hypothetical protein